MVGGGRQFDGLRPEGAAVSLRKVDGKKTAKFLLAIFGMAVAAIAASYVIYPIHSVLHRSVATVAGTEWMSWDKSILSFDKDRATHRTQSYSRTLPYEERDGAIKIMDGEADYMILTRFGDARLITSDGRTIFYMKTAVSGSSSEKGSEQRGSSGEESRETSEGTEGADDEEATGDS